MKVNKQPFSDLISALPNLFGIFGSKRRELERLSDSMNLDRDYTPGIDDDFTAWNLPEEE